MKRLIRADRIHIRHSGRVLNEIEKSSIERKKDYYESTVNRRKYNNKIRLEEKMRIKKAVNLFITALYILISESIGLAVSMSGQSAQHPRCIAVDQPREGNRGETDKGCCRQAEHNGLEILIVGTDGYLPDYQSA